MYALCGAECIHSIIQPWGAFNPEQRVPACLMLSRPKGHQSLAAFMNTAQITNVITAVVSGATVRWVTPFRLLACLPMCMEVGAASLGE